MSSPSSELKNIILRAGAGAGKTTTLTQTFLQYASDFKSQQGRFPRIVVTTFTRKATQELKERLLGKALEMQREDLFHYISAKSQVQISTIHGVLSLFLSRYGSYAGLTPDYKILADGEIRRGARKLIRQHLLTDAELQELLEEYDFKVLEAALLEYFTQSLITPELQYISAVELERETKKLIGDIFGRLQRVTSEIQHEASHEKWQAYAAALGDFSLKKDEPWESFFERLENLWSAQSKPQFRKATPPFSSSLHDELEELRERVDKLLEEPRYRPAFWQRHERNCSLFERLARLFREDFLKSKLEQGLLAMSDLESLAYLILKNNPETAQRFSEEWDFWMVDEYQDTSPVQVELLRQLIGARPAFVVGDPQQSIYLFRGARSEVFQEKMAEIAAQGGEVREQLVNYRSSPEVLHFFNHYFTRLSSQFAAMTPGPDKKGSGVEHPVVQVLRAEAANEESEDGASPEVLTVVARIQELLQEGLSPEQICVLGRTHKSLEDVAKIAQEYGVPLQLHSGSGFYERREVLDALALLRFLVNPHDNANFVALLRSPWLRVRDSELITYCHHSQHSFWWEAQAALKSVSVQHPLSVLRELLVLSESKGLSWTLKKALIQLGFFDYAIRMDSSGRREANLWKVLSLLSQEERRPGFNFLDFLDASLESLSVDEGSEDADATPVVEPKR
ncbi:MAG: UvrD-helicase domain-containing protein, partial [Bdellovibrio sp.]